MESLDFAYKFPFSQEAKEIVQRQPNQISIKYLDLGGSQIEAALSNSLDYSDIRINSVKLDYIMTYLYSRMLLSAVKRPDLIKLYAIAEAGRSSSALLASENTEVMRLCSELNIRVAGTFDNRADQFSIRFTDYTSNAPRSAEYELVNQRLSGGIVMLDKNALARIIEQAMIKEIMRGLPIKGSELPREVVEYSKSLRLKPAAKIETKGRGKRSEEWIENLLRTPIADVRHRTVNLILAPYLVNTKELSIEQAVKIISDYIERCRQIDPNTKINERYIEYQCNYAKRKGLRPLSYDRAKELLGEIIETSSNKA